MKIRLGALSLGLLLTACGDDQPPVAPVAKPIESEPQVVSPAAIATPLAVPEPAPAPAPAPAHAAVAEPQSKPAALPELPASPIDLSLPRDLLDDWQLGEAIPQEHAQPLLPPLFVEKPEPEDNLQLNGRLLLKEDAKDYSMESVDGLQLQLELKR